MSRYIDPVPQYMLDDGSLASSGRLKFFVNRDYSTLKNTYFDSDKTILNLNPLPLDGSGRVPPCFGTGLYSVKFYAYDEDSVDGLGTLQWTRDDVSLAELTGQLNAWVPISTYNINDIVSYSDGNYYQSLQNFNKGNVPSSATTFWTKVVFITTFRASRSYPVDYIVEWFGRLYRSNTTPNIGNTPPAAQWDDLTFNNAIAGNLSVSGSVTASSFVGGSVPRVSKKVIETARASTTTLAADPDLTIPLPISSFFKVTAHIVWDGNGSAVNGLQARIGVTDATLYSAFYLSSRNTSSSNVGATSNTNTNVPLGYNILPAFAGGTDILIIEALISTNGSGSPVVFFEWSQSASNATTTRVKVPSTLIAIKI